MTASEAPTSSHGVCGRPRFNRPWAPRSPSVDLSGVPQAHARTPISTVSKWALCMSLVAYVGACSKSETVNAFPDQFVGVGLELKVNDGVPSVVRTLKGGPAAEAGMQAGDPILEIDGASTRGLTLGDVVMKLRGRPQTQVSLTVQRGEQRIVVVVLRQAMLRSEQSDYHAAQP